MSDRPAAVDETTMKFGLLMESAQAHQKLAETHLERLRAHTQDLDGVCARRFAVRSSRSSRGQRRKQSGGTGAARRETRRRHARTLIERRGRGTFDRGPFAFARWILPSPAQIDALRARRDQLAANVSRLEQQGGRIEWRRCGESARLCVHVDRTAPAYGDKGDYFVVKGY